MKNSTKKNERRSGSILRPHEDQESPIDASSALEIVDPAADSAPSVAYLVIEKDHFDIITANNLDVYFLERNNILGVCVESTNETLSWTPIKISRSSGVRAADSKTRCLSGKLFVTRLPTN